jgi:hypothetical protein
MGKHFDLRTLNYIARVLTENPKPAYYKQATHTAINVDISNEDFEFLRGIAEMDIDSKAKELRTMIKKYNLKDEDLAYFQMVILSL